ncbi:MAG TPA: hypothetical protein VGK54_04870 [Chloroflexota bacterium]|jgi:hypothetical protein
MNRESVTKMIETSIPIVRRALVWGGLILPVLASAACTMAGGAPRY